MDLTTKIRLLNYLREYWTIGKILERTKAVARENSVCVSEEKIMRVSQRVYGEWLSGIDNEKIKVLSLELDTLQNTKSLGRE